MSRTFTLTAICCNVRAMQPFIICTAGHIDHGKTALVKALTGTDTDRLKEEKERGITIELGYAFLSDAVAFVDVPGHERFIKNMAAGAATVDFALLVVAADDGIMPQTREHLDILRLLGIQDGVTAITKCDLMDEDWIDLVEADLRDLTDGTFLEGRPIVRVDSLSGRGVDTLREALFSLSAQKRGVDQSALFRLNVDRVFSVKGFGTVVTGSALSGAVHPEDKLTLLPKGLEVRVRGIESQGRRLPRGTGGMRLALNLAPVGVEDIERGDVLVTPERMRPTFMLDTTLSVLASSPIPVRQRERVRVHLGCAEIMARVVLIDKDALLPGETGFAQLRLESMTAALRLDRFVIRRYSPQLTIGGGQVLDANPEKHRRRDEERVVRSLERLGESKGAALIEGILAREGVLPFDDLAVKAALPTDQVEEEIADLSVAGRVLELEARGARQIISVALLERFESALEAALSAFHAKNPLKVGAKKGEVLNRAGKGLPDFVLKQFLDKAVERGVIALKGDDLIAAFQFEVKLSDKQKKLLRDSVDAIVKGGFQPPDLSFLSAAFGAEEKSLKGLLQLKVDEGLLVCLDGKIYFHVDSVNEGVVRLREAFGRQESLSMSDFRQLLGTTRKYALPLLNYYDNKGITQRKDEIRLPGPKLNN